MNKRVSILIAALMAATGLTGLYAESYDFRIGEPTAAATEQLSPGVYRLEFKEGIATLTNTRTGKNVKVPVKVTNAEKKFKATAVHVDSNGNRLKSIDLAGSNIRLEFAD